jgi:glycosyltransferase involved in cell wall biosynthesis
MKIVFCWSVISGYMAACWRELARRSGVDLHVVAHRAGTASSFADDLLDDIPHALLSPHDQNDYRAIERMVAEQKPDIVAMTGWWLAPYRNLVHASSLANARFIMGVDSPWRHEAQFLTRFRYGRSFRRVDHFFVTGERSWQYVKRLGVSPERISRGMYGVDVAAWSQVVPRRKSGDWPRRFLFLGRYAREKALDILVDGYREYRSRVQDPWDLVCCGKGPDASLLATVNGIQNRGFVQPQDLPDVFTDSGAFVMPSRFDPWPLALVEAAAAGLPIICSEACGSAVEVVRPWFNGFIVPSESSAHLATTMEKIHALERSMPLWGDRSNLLATAYSAERWADRWLDVCGQLLSSPRIA